MAGRKGGLGKGLEALFTDNATGDVNSATRLRLSEIEPNKAQPRKDFDEEALASLADSIKEQGAGDHQGAQRPGDHGNRPH